MAVAEIRPDWTVGTLTLTSGSVNFTTSGSALQTAAIQAGDAIITRSGDFLVIATITGQNSGTLMQPCPAGAAGAGQPLRIRFQPDGSRYNGATADLVNLLGSGNVYEFAGLTGSANGVPVFTGSGTMEVQDKSTFSPPDPNQNLSQLGGLSKLNNQFITMGSDGAISKLPLSDKFDSSGGFVYGNLDMQGTIRMRSANNADNAPFQYVKDYNYVDRWAFLMYPNNDFLYCVWSGAGYVRDVVRFSQNGSVQFFGSLSKAGGTFLIDHPLDPLNKNLRHGFVEAPEYLNIYRGTVRLVNGRATVNIDDYFDMMQGTFWALNTDVVVSSLQNQDGFSRVRPDGKMTDGTLNIICEDETCNDEVAWMVTGRRKDAYVLHMDPNCERGTGKFITEVEKDD